jgi:hypothetical protein
MNERDERANDGQTGDGGTKEGEVDDEGTRDEATGKGRSEDQQFAEVRCKICKGFISYGEATEGGILCDECREKYLHYPMPKWLVLSVMLVIILIVYQIVTAFPAGYEYRKNLDNARNCYNEQRFASTVANYERVEEIGIYKEDYCKLFIAYVRQYEYEKAWMIADEKLYNQEIDSETLYEAVDKAYYEMVAYYDMSEEFGMQIENILNMEANEQVIWLNEYIEEHPSEYYAYYFLNAAYFNLSEYELAIEAANQGALLKPNLVTINNIMLVGSYRQLNNFSKAYELNEAVLKINQEDTIGISSMARTMIKEKKYEEALDYLLAQNEFVQENEYFQETLAMAYHYTEQNELRDEVVAQLLTDETYDSEFLLEVIHNESTLYQ